MADGARERREAIRQLADLRRRLAAAEDTVTDALAALKAAEGAFDAASDSFDAAERMLDAAREERAQARRDRYTARQAYERASTTADRLARRVRDLAHHLDRPAELAGVRRARTSSCRTGVPIVEVGVRCPARWPYPERCGGGHEWGPGLVLVSWQQCQCAGAKTLHPDRAIWGHFTVACRVPECRSVWYDPPHKPTPQA